MLHAVIGVSTAFILLASLFTGLIYAEPPKAQNKTSAKDDKKYYDYTNYTRYNPTIENGMKKYDYSNYTLHKDPNKVSKPPIPKDPGTTKFKTPDGIKILTKSKGTMKKAKTGIRSR